MSLTHSRIAPMTLLALMLEVGTSVAQPMTTEFNVRIPMRDGVS